MEDSTARSGLRGAGESVRVEPEISSEPRSGSNGETHGEGEWRYSPMGVSWTFAGNVKARGVSSWMLAGNVNARGVGATMLTRGGWGASVVASNAPADGKESEPRVRWAGIVLWTGDGGRIREVCRGLMLSSLPKWMALDGSQGGWSRIAEGTLSQGGGRTRANNEQS